MGTGASVTVDGIRSQLEADVGATSDVELADEQVAELQAMYAVRVCVCVVPLSVMLSESHTLPNGFFRVVVGVRCRRVVGKAFAGRLVTLVPYHQR